MLALVSCVDAAFSCEIAASCSIILLISFFIAVTCFVCSEIFSVAPDTLPISVPRPIKVWFKPSRCSIWIPTFCSTLPMRSTLTSLLRINWLTISAICSAPLLLSSERLRISSATTANPLPDSPARAASIEAFKESRFVCCEISWIKLTASLIFCAEVFVLFVSSFNMVTSCEVFFPILSNFWSAP